MFQEICVFALALWWYSEALSPWLYVHIYTRTEMKIRDCCREGRLPFQTAEMSSEYEALVQDRKYITASTHYNVKVLNQSVFGVKLIYFLQRCVDSVKSTSAFCIYNILFNFFLKLDCTYRLVLAKPAEHS